MQSNGLFLESARDLALQGEEGVARKYLAILANELREESPSIEACRYAAELLSAAGRAPERDMRRVLGLQAKGRTKRLLTERIDSEVIQASRQPGASKEAAYRQVAEANKMSLPTVKRMHLSMDKERQQFDELFRGLFDADNVARPAKGARPSRKERPAKKSRA